MTTTINTTVTSTVTLGSGSTDTDVLVGASGSVEPTGYAMGVYSSVPNGLLENFGTIDGSGGGAGYEGSAGVQFTALGNVSNYGVIKGGNGFNAATAPNAFAGIGGVGVVLSGGGQFTNDNAVAGGTGYGKGVDIVYHGGDGADLSGGAKLTNSTYNFSYGTITGGDGKDGAAGGNGVDLTGASGSNDAQATITGGSGTENVGGVGIELFSSSSFTNKAGGTIKGGDSTFAGAFNNSVGGEGVWANDSQLSNYGDITAGITTANSLVVGSIGVLLTAGASLQNYLGSTITGGKTTALGQNLGTGGTGVLVDTGTSYLQNAGKITGGAGSFDGGVGAWVFTDSTDNTNHGTITGGLGANKGGSGAYLSAGKLTNFGKIDGGGTTNVLGGTGAEAHTGATLDNESGGNITGGANSAVYGASGTGVLVNAGFLVNHGGIYGGLNTAVSNSAGGVGAYIIYSSVVSTNDGTITGGNATGGSATTAGGLSGGAGAYVGKNGQLTNSGQIGGGSANGPSGFGGNGINLGAGSIVTNTHNGTIIGGAAAVYPSYGSTGGVGASISGGTLITAGSISGGIGASGQAAAVSFAGTGGTLQVETGASFTGAIAGFEQGDTIDIAQLTISASDFDISTDTLTLGVGDSLQLNGTFIAGELQFNSDGNQGTDITLAPEDEIRSVVYQAVDIGTTTYPSPLIVDYLASIHPTPGTSTVGITSSRAGAALYNGGRIYGGSSNGSAGGGAGIQFSAAGTVHNVTGGFVQGGAGYQSGYATSLTGAGGVGISLAGGSVFNAGTVLGGEGYGAPGVSGASGGTGVYVKDGAFTNAGYGSTAAVINGGVGVGIADGGVGVSLAGGAGSNAAHDRILGGQAKQGTSGIGVTLSSTATFTNASGGTISGGNRFDSDPGLSVSTLGGGVYAASSTLINHGGIYGGENFTADALVAAGGFGVSLKGGSATNDGVIQGGTGVVSHTGQGTGGTGVILMSAAAFTNSGQILGGYGTSGPGGTEIGGTGIEISGGSTVLNYGDITGGQTGAGVSDAVDGVGVYINGGTLTTAGFIGVGLHSTGAAVKFGSTLSTMNVKSGASFYGSILDFKHGDKIDITNLSLSQVTSDFDSTTETLTTVTDGTLRFSGSDLSGNFIFSNDGQGGTDITLATSDESVISTAIARGVQLGGGLYLNSVVITGSGLVTAEGDATVLSTQAGGQLINYGYVNAGLGSNDAGGIGVDFKAAGTIKNAGYIKGGQGYFGPHDLQGGNGGDSVYLKGGTLDNLGTIMGGAGVGTGYFGGSGVRALGGAAVTNESSGTIKGGQGTYGAAGGAGVYLGGGTLTTAGAISGGTGKGGVAASVQFHGSNSTLTVKSGASFTGAIAGFAYGDRIDLTDVSVSQAKSDFNAGTEKLTTGVDGTLQFSGAFAPNQFQFTSDGGTGSFVTLLMRV